MKLTLQIKLKPDNEQKKSLLNTIKEANIVCNELSEFAFENKVFNQFKLHKAKYYSIKSSFNLSAQMVVRCISKVSDSYKPDKKKQRVFKELGGITYDSRILSYNIDKRICSIWSVDSRLKIPFIPYPEKYLPYIKGEANLIYKKGKFYLFQACEVPEEDIKDVEEFIGVDFGINNIATLSNGVNYSSEKLNSYREKRQKIRSSIQSKGTGRKTTNTSRRNHKKLMKRLRGKESRTGSIINHTISKNIISIAKTENKGIAIENLKGIRKNAFKRNKTFRRKLGNWSFYQLKEYLLYKAKREGIPVVEIPSAYTSQMCSQCFHLGKRNNEKFNCDFCGHSEHADINASKNISQIGAAFVNLPEKQSMLYCPVHCLKLPALAVE